ncbi:heparin lyase I family protein [Defluviimonas aestuarii]|uniref:heparin lyase I family protein n=1 Tax=Albidovulum aestuarii TaxID=1130726 RepID=UPI002499AD9C|nr:heparin lyase I family protein [Defluviimonas aestuarii]MDI3334846.1 heparin lyase I family protein [Defluviimonas aestuarii]
MPDSYQVLADSFEDIEAEVVHAFSIYGGECLSAKYSDGSGKGDCTYGSVRSILRETNRSGPYHFAQPEQAWYSWNMLIPSSYPTLGRQTAGSYTFVQWKGFDCPHATLSHSARPGHDNTLLLRLNRTTGEHDCAATAEVILMPMNQFKGSWRQVEVFAKWSTGPDGRMDVYIDGQRRGSYNGPTLDPNMRSPTGRPDAPNHFDIGSYLCCTGGVELIKPGTVYFANMTRDTTKITK